jgi:hypothetical protein
MNRFTRLLSLAFLSVTSVAMAIADEELLPCDAYLGDEVWLISSRDFDCCTPLAVEQLPCMRYSNGCWSAADWSELRAGCQAADLQNFVFVHGYRTALADAQKRGLQVYAKLFCTERTSCPVRFIIWAWKSESEVKRPYKDFVIKSHRAIALKDIFSLALNELGPRAPIVCAYSLGVQVAVSAMTQSDAYTGVPIQFVAIATVNDCGFQSCDNKMFACGHIDRSFLFLNSGDRAVRAANRVCRLKYGPAYKPFEEFAVDRSEYLGQVHWVDITEVSPNTHSIVEYSSVPEVRCFLQQIVNENCQRSAHIMSAGTGKIWPILEADIDTSARNSELQKLSCLPPPPSQSAR